ncbi:inorganic pyrophosphatase [Puteibacter caeruleilacunae]|nr:inorganic pyrophosphatase [Puteibacter caeruleilacunae]
MMERDLQVALQAFDNDFWQGINELVQRGELVIDRPKGTRHSNYPDFVYPFDYGYIKDTRSSDGDEIDVWQGSIGERSLQGILVTIDFGKRDLEIKILMGCTDEDIVSIYRENNKCGMHALWLPYEYDVENDDNSGGVLSIMKACS